MSKLETEKKVLSSSVTELEEQLAKAKRRLERLEKVQTIDEPPPGTVLRFSRPLTDSPTSRKYTFVAFRADDKPESWYVVGKKTTLANLLHLSDGANSWEDLLVAIGDAKLRFATEWSDTPGLQFNYFLGFDSSNVFRSRKNADNNEYVEVFDRFRPVNGWRRAGMTTRGWVVSNPGSYRPLTPDEVRTRGIEPS